jgi:hypothetical protein
MFQSLAQIGSISTRPSQNLHVLGTNDPQAYYGTEFFLEIALAMVPRNMTARLITHAAQGISISFESSKESRTGCK